MNNQNIIKVGYENKLLQWFYHWMKYSTKLFDSSYSSISVLKCRLPTCKIVAQKPKQHNAGYISTEMAGALFRNDSLILI